MSSTSTHRRLLSELAHRIDSVVDEVEPGAVLPMVDVIREHGRLVLRADMPGIRAEDVKIEVVDDVLTVRGKHEESEVDEGRHYIRRERRYGGFVRSLALPSGVDAGRIEATCRDGVLEVIVPLPALPEHRVVEIKATAG